MFKYFWPKKVPRIGLLLTLFFCSLVDLEVNSQCTSAVDLYRQVEALGGLNNDEVKLQKARELQQRFEQCHFEKDSVYVRILDRIGLFFYLTGKLDSAIAWGYKATAVSAFIKNKSHFIAAKAYLNLGLYLNEVHQSLRALAMYDTTTRLCSKADARTNVVCINALKSSVYVLYNFGEYKQCVDKATLVIPLLKVEQDSISLAKMYAMRGQASLHLNQATNADKDAATALAIVERWGGYPNNIEAYLNAVLVKAKINVRLNQTAKSDSIFGAAIQNCRRLDVVNPEVYNFYMDYGNYLSDHKKNFSAAIKWYNQCIEQDKLENKATAYLNISQNYWRLRQYDDAERYFYLARNAQHPQERIQNFSSLISANKWNLISNKNQLTVTINNNLELLLTRFELTGKSRYLSDAKSLSQTGDSVLTLLRHEQVEEVSKLYWREQTREFYRYALETACLLKDNELAFYFMEKSRAVLLNDKLNELAASNLLPAAVRQKEQDLSLSVVQQQYLLNSDPQQAAEPQVNLVKARDALAQYVNALEKDYPAYYQLKYADKVPTLSELQHYLKTNEQTFVHYFMADTVAYILKITPTDTRVIKLSKPYYDPQKIIAFLNYCSQPQRLNAGFAEFGRLSSYIYQQFIAPLTLSTRRVIICPDNFLIPFEGILQPGKNNLYLVQQYAFSYVYAARNLLMTSQARNASGNFFGVAPVEYASYMSVPKLSESADATRQSSGFYSSKRLVTGSNATKAAFLRNIGRYDVVNVFSHAVADSSVQEPAIFMGDSMIYLSEMQQIDNICTQLVLLSACQTSVGKNAAGEGIYSLARGLAAVGIPSVAATLWEADENAIYALSEKFNEGISKGLPKDIALQQAKLWYLSEFNGEKSLPSYWANMILIGNASPVQFSEHPRNYILWSVIVGCVAVAAVIIAARKKRRQSRYPEPA